MCLSDKPAAVPAAKKAAVDGKLFFVSEPQSIRVVESKYFVNSTSSSTLYNFTADLILEELIREN